MKKWREPASQGTAEENRICGGNFLRKEPQNTMNEEGVNADEILPVLADENLPVFITQSKPTAPTRSRSFMRYESALRLNTWA